MYNMLHILCHDTINTINICGYESSHRNNEKLKRIVETEEVALR